MTLDVRARVTCNLGTLISASISDDYIQGAGLIKTSGSCELSGVYSLSPGDRVTFSYTKSGITRSIPRSLRVLSSFADPFRRITTVELGCKLTYLQDLTDPINWDAFDDPENADRTEEEASIVTIPIYARSIMQKCLNELGISATSNPLTNRFSVAEFDFSSGYVSVLSDLLVSESYCGYLDINERLVIINLSAEGGSGPLIGSDKLIDIGPIGVGQLPGDAVTVSYSTLKLKAPDGSEKDPDQPGSGDSNDSGGPWGSDQQYSESKSVVSINWTDKNTGSGQYRTYNVLETSRTTTSYSLLTIQNSDGTKTRKNLVTSRTTVTTSNSAAIAGNIYSEYLSNGLPVNFFTLTSTTTETFEYDNLGRETLKVTEKIISDAEELGALGIKFVFPDGVINFSTGTIRSEKQVTTYTNLANFQASRTETYKTWARTIQGQQAIALARSNLKTKAAMLDYISSIYRAGLFLDRVDFESSETGSRPEQAPLPGEIANEANGDDGFSTESKSEIEFVTGNRSAQRRIEFSMPYAPDDIFIKVGSKYLASSSDAKQKANAFGRIQNRMLLGNRSGMNIQVAPETLPTEPFAPVFIQAGSVVALYRLNATSWTIDQNGIIASTDAMFWGAAGKTT